MDMDRPTPIPLRIGDWHVNPQSGQISRNGETARVEARTMRLLLCLAEHSGEVVSIDDLLTQVWSDVTVSPDSVYQAVTSLRRLLGDDPKQPTYIATVPRLGYRMLAKVTPWDQFTDGSIPNRVRADAFVRPSTQVPASESEIMPAPPRRSGFAWTVAALFCLALVVAAFLVHGKLASNHPSTSPTPNSQPQKSIAVLPFLDLTEGMKEEEFADGMTEELIDKLTRIPGLQVPPPTSSFYFKGKQIPVADIAKTLGVAYVLDGSVRKSAGRVRIAARLVRADNGYVTWSETYDRPFTDILMIQDEIATEVTKALRNAIDPAPTH